MCQAQSLENISRQWKYFKIWLLKIFCWVRDWCHQSWGGDGTENGINFSVLVEDIRDFYIKEIRRWGVLIKLRVWSIILELRDACTVHDPELSCFINSSKNTKESLDFKLNKWLEVFLLYKFLQNNIIFPCRTAG